MIIAQALHLIKDTDDGSNQKFILDIWHCYYELQAVYHTLRKLK